MSLFGKDQVLSAEITDSKVAALVANALRKEYAKSDAAVKRIERITGANSSSIKKWISGRHAPKSGHLLVLAKHYPYILCVILELIDRSDVWEVYTQQSIPNKDCSDGIEKTTVRGNYYDKFVAINVVIDSHIAGQFNQRQLWLLGKLQQGNKVNKQDLISVWRITGRTAQRDIAGLIAAGLICFIGAKKNGHYRQTSKN